jgi:hypothetical protein
MIDAAETERRLAEIEVREHAAKVGPWTWKDNGYLRTGIGEWTLSNTDIGICDCDEYAEPDPVDRDFIAHARADVPWLIALARRGLSAVELAEAADARRAALDKHERVDEPDCLAALEAFDTALDNWRRAKARQA